MKNLKLIIVTTGISLFAACSISENKTNDP